MKRLPQFVLVLLVAGVVFAGCRCGTLTSSEFDKRYPYGQGRLFTSKGILAFRAELREELAGGRLLDLSLTASTASIEVLHQNGRDRDRIYYNRGSFGKPDPQRTSVHEGHQDGVLDVEQIPFDKLPALVRAAPVRLEIPDGRVTSVDVQDGHRLRLSVQGARRTGSVLADHTGNIIEARVD